MDATTRELCYPELIKFVPDLHEANQLLIPEGEAHKTLQTCEQLWSRLLKEGADRDALLINLGGGMLCDLGGFAAAVFKRGIPFIHVPTTLLAITDAAIGGKTGVNFNGYKNQLGSFTDAHKTVIYPGFLATLDERQFRAGFAEMVKHALIANKNLWDQLAGLKTLNLESVESLIWPSIKVKQTIVEKDRLEAGERKKLNFGHTIGHALESYSLELDADPLYHGEAVALGVLTESHIAHQMGFLGKRDLDSIVRVIRTHFPAYPLSEGAHDRLFDYMQTDKKNVSGKLNFTLIAEPGHALVDCYPESTVIIREALKVLKQ